MRRIQNGVIIAGSVLAIGAVYGSTWLQLRPFGVDRASAHDRYVQSQVIGNAERLARIVAPDRVMERFEAFREPFPTSGGSPPRIWAVQCTGESGEEVGFSWDASTGRLLTVSRTRPVHGPVRRPIPARDAVRCGAQWLRLLDVSDAATTWHLAGRPERNLLAWVFRLESAGQRVTIHIDACDGSLQYARFVP
jgi:hypothetical protein